jgi:hypothetical protein
VQRARPDGEYEPQHEDEAAMFHGPASETAHR